MYTGQMDLYSWIVYLGLGLLGYVCIRFAKKDQGCVQVFQKFSFQKRYIGYLVLVLVFTFFATFRKVGTMLGGADAQNYSNYFINCFNPESYEYGLISEPLFRYFAQFIRLFTDNPRVFFAISYGFIALCYCLFVEEYCPKDSSMIPFVLLIFPYLKAFCTLRSSLAVAVFLIALILVEKKPWLSICLMISTVFIHRMSIAYAVFFIFDRIMGNTVIKTQGVKLGKLLFLVSFIGIWSARLVQWVVPALGILDTTDNWYLLQSMGTSLIFSLPMYFAHLLVFFFLVLFGDRVNTKHWVRIKSFLAFDLVIIPATILLGFWRSNEYMYVVRLVAWSQLIPAGEAVLSEVYEKYRTVIKRWIKLEVSKEAFVKIYRVALACCFAGWLVFRILSEWDDLKIMPYILNFYW